MGVIFFGVLALLATMGLVMGGPLMFYMKRDQAWLADPQHSIENWYR